MSRSFGLVDYKVQEAEFFLLELKRNARHTRFCEVQYCVSAFVSAARSITFAMQASLKSYPEYDPWYESRQAMLRDDPLSRFFQKFRTLTQHIGANVVGGGSFSKGKKLYYFIPCRDLPNVPNQDVITACQDYFVTILQIVYDCYLELGPIVDGQQYFTAGNFAALGKTIEDAEEELGLPRKWTDIGKIELEPYRWELLRRQAEGCLIEPQFQRWLNKQLPHKVPLPPIIL